MGPVHIQVHDSEAAGFEIIQEASIVEVGCHPTGPRNLLVEIEDLIKATEDRRKRQPPKPLKRASRIFSLLVRHS
jgi:hypothetical protein